MEGRSKEAGWWEEKRIMGGEKHLLCIMELIRSVDNVFMRGCYCYCYVRSVDNQPRTAPVTT